MPEQHPPITETTTGAASNGCPVVGHMKYPVEGGGNQDWWPNRLNLKVLHQNPAVADPMGAAFDYAAEVATIDVDALTRDIEEVMTTSQPWWPADYGHYGPLFIRMAWHAAGTYRIHDGRGGAGGGMQRFAPLKGPNGNPDPMAAAVDIRETFRRMAMNDVETAALIVGGHTFGKTHGAGPADLVGPEPEAAPLEQMGLGWKSSYGTGTGKDAITSGIEVVWTNTPTKWDNSFLEILYGYEWELTKSPAGAWQYTAKDGAGAGTIPDPFGGPGRSPTMLATDLSLRVDPIYERITRRWLEHPEELADEFAKAWYKLIHRDMGPVARYLGPLVPKQTLLWQDPVPAVSHDLVGEAEIASLKSQILASGLTVSQLVSTAWAAASSFRGSDKRGGANGGRIRLQPQVGWEVNDPDGDLRKVIRTLEEIQESFNSAAPGNIKVSFADLVVLGGCAAIEKAAKAAGHNITVPFTPGRTDASQEQTDVESFAVLEPKADGFRNYLGKGNPLPAEYMLLDKANLLTLSAPEMTVLVGGLRVLGANYKRLPLGVFTEASESLTNDFFVNLLDMGITWEPSPADDGTYQGKDGSGKVKWTGSRVDLVFGSNSELRALVEVYGADDAQPKFVQDFVAAWDKVMNLDRFDVR